MVNHAVHHTAEIGQHTHIMHRLWFVEVGCVCVLGQAKFCCENL